MIIAAMDTFQPTVIGPFSSALHQDPKLKHLNTLGPTDYTLNYLPSPNFLPIMKREKVEGFSYHLFDNVAGTSLLRPLQCGVKSDRVTKVFGTAFCLSEYSAASSYTLIQASDDSSQRDSVRAGIAESLAGFEQFAVMNLRSHNAEVFCVLGSGTRRAFGSQFIPTFPVTIILIVDL